MKATLGLELFNDDQRHYWKLAKATIDESLGPGAGDAVFGNLPKQTWVAEIIGTDTKYKFKRAFLNGKKDYSKANLKGSRGIFVWYILKSGRYYDIKSQTSWKTIKRYFCKVDDSTGNIIEVTEKEVKTWLKENSDLTC